MTSSALVALLLLAPQNPVPSPGSKVIDVRATRPPAGNTFEALWWTYRHSEERGDNDAASTALREIGKMRIERNVVRLEPFALARVAQGLARLREGQLDKADVEFRAAITLDPYQADGYFGLAQSARRRGVSGLWSAARYACAGFAARMGSIGGQHYLFALLVPAGILALLLTITLLAAALLLRSWRLLLHDLEESLGPDRRTLARTLLGVLLALPVLALQGWGWLPLWWLTLMFLYLTNTEKVAVGVALASTLAIVPLAHMLDERMATVGNPLFQASLTAIEGGPDARATTLLEKAAEGRPTDKDLPYLIAALYKKAGRYEDAALLYNTLLQSNAGDAYALNNLGNLSFAGAEFQAALPRYTQGLATEPAADVAATLYYNQALAYLQKFERQPANEARSQADRLAPDLTRSYETTWRYDFSNEGAVVDLRPTPDELWRKFFGRASGVVRENVSGSRTGAPSTLLSVLQELPNRFAAAMIVFGLTIFALSRWRGPRAFTMRCVKCGTPFCRRCHIGPASSGLCTQCHHLFVVRDGVSGPARNQKLLEVQAEDKRRELVFRVLSLVAPGAGHAYARRVLSGLGFLFVWAALLSLALVAGLLLPFTDAPSMIAPSWGWALGAAVLLAVYVAANRARPDFEVFIPAGRHQPRRRGRAA